MYFGDMCPLVAPPQTRLAVSGTLAASLPCPATDVELRPSFRLLPSFSKMDHIHRPPTVSGLAQQPPPPLKKPSICRVCRLRFASEVQLMSHHCSPKQASKSKLPDPAEHKTKTWVPCTADKKEMPATGWQICSDGIKTGDLLDPSSDSSPSSTISNETRSWPPKPLPSPQQGAPESHEAGPEGETEEEKAVRLLYCSLCKVAVNSASQLQAHNSGTKHKTMLEARSGDGAIKSFPRGGVKSKLAVVADLSTGLQNKTFHCEICDVHVNSETQLKQHISSRRHKDRAAGKPAKPKFSPYPPGQRHQSFQSLRLTLQQNQDWTKPLTSCLLQRHLCVATAIASSPTLPLGHASNSGLLQSPALPPPPLLHPAPAPLCSAQVLFSPY